MPSTPLSTSPNFHQLSYAEVISIEKTTLSASTGLEEELARLSTNTDETAESSPEVTSDREEAEGQRAVVAGPGKGTRPDPKAAAKEKRKRKRLAAKAAAAAAKLKVAAGDVVHVSDVTDVAMVDNVAEKVDTTSTSKVVAEDETFTLVSPRQGRSVRKPFSLRQKTP